MHGLRASERIAGAAALAIGGLALIVACLWALSVPIFLQPDEDSHYDYALTLRTAGRPLRPSEQAVGRDTHPVVAYLMTTTHARAVRLDDRVGADRGYRSAGYARSLDAGAPRVDAAAFRRGPIAPAPYIARLYPLGYYALAAAVVAMREALGRPSVVADFFAVRFLSVVLLAPTLAFLWYSLRELGVGPRLRVPLFACAALLPMTLWVSGSVQPDALAGTLVGAATYLALRLRRRPRTRAALAVLGVVLACLVATKRHYFVATFVPIVAMLAARLPRGAGRRAPLYAALLAGPSLVAFAATEAWMRAAPPETGLCRYDAARFEPHRDLARTFAHGLRTACARRSPTRFCRRKDTFRSGSATRHTATPISRSATPRSIGSSSPRCPQ